MDEMPTIRSTPKGLEVSGHNLTFLLTRGDDGWLITSADHDHTPPLRGDMLIPAGAPEAAVVAGFVAKASGGQVDFANVIALYAALFGAADRLEER